MRRSLKMSMACSVGALLGAAVLGITSPVDEAPAVAPAPARYAAVDMLTVGAGGKLSLVGSQVQPVPNSSTWTQYINIMVQDVTPPTPINFTGNDLLNGREVLITWDVPPSPYISGFELERERLITPGPPAVWGETALVGNTPPDPVPPGWQPLATNPTARSHRDSTNGPGTYRYRLRSVNNR